MSYLKKTVAVLLVAVMVIGLVACKKEPASAPTDEVKKSPLYQETTRTLRIGAWYEQYYTSAHDDIYDNPAPGDIDNAEKNLQNMRTIEKRYNIELYYDNLTWNGVIASINTSIMAGAPDCDVYMLDLQFGIPAIVNDYAYSLEYILNESPEASLIEERYKDILSPEGSEVVAGMSFTTDGLTYIFSGKTKVNLAAYTLGYNKSLLDAYGLEDPNELLTKGEWTFDKWMEHMIELTDDLDGDGATDQWGFRGPWTNLLIQLLMANGTYIAAIEADETGKIVEQLTSPETTEVLNFLYDMYQTYKVSFWDADCDADWNANVYAWAEGNIGYWVDACWIAQSADPDMNMIDDRGVVMWPAGPSGDIETNANINSTQGTYFMIPVGIENPALVYCVLYDYMNWYQDDLTLRDDTSWAEEWSYNDDNFQVLVEMGNETSDSTLDLWQQISFDESYQIRGLIETSPDAVPITVAEFQQANKQIVQDYLDTTFNK